MSAKRITMRQLRELRELLRLRYEAGLSIRQINASTKISVGKCLHLRSTKITEN